MSDIYVFDGSFYMTFVQPFYDSNNIVLGVLGSDIRLDANGLSGLADTVMANVHQKEMTLVEHLGAQLHIPVCLSLSPLIHLHVLNSGHVSL